MATAAVRRAYVLFRYQLDMRKSEPDHSDETNQFLTELERDTKPDSSNGFHGYLQMMELQREKAVKCIRPMTQVDILRRMEMCATKLKNEVQVGR